MPEISYQLEAKINAKYKGFGRYDMISYLTCRLRANTPDYTNHYLTLKKYYRQSFLHNPFRKA